MTAIASLAWLLLTGGRSLLQARLEAELARACARTDALALRVHQRRLDRLQRELECPRAKPRPPSEQRALASAEAQAGAALLAQAGAALLTPSAARSPSALGAR